MTTTMTASGRPGGFLIPAALVWCCRGCWGRGGRWRMRDARAGPGYLRTDETARLRRGHSSRSAHWKPGQSPDAQDKRGYDVRVLLASSRRVWTRLKMLICQTTLSCHKKSPNICPHPPPTRRIGPPNCPAGKPVIADICCRLWLGF